MADAVLKVKGWKGDKVKKWLAPCSLVNLLTPQLARVKGCLRLLTCWLSNPKNPIDSLYVPYDLMSDMGQSLCQTQI